MGAPLWEKHPTSRIAGQNLKGNVKILLFLKEIILTNLKFYLNTLIINNIFLKKIRN